MAKGDHLVVSHRWYSHHGIDLGNGFVAHYGRGLGEKHNARVEVVAFERFAQGRRVSVGKTCSHYSPDQIVGRALSRLGERRYDLFENNCEHFVNWCRNQNAESYQIRQIDTTSRRLVAVGSKLKWMRSARHLSLASLATRSSPAAIWGASLAADAVQFSCETLFNRLGYSTNQSRRTARAGAIVTAVGVGWWFAGPIGASAATAVCVASENVAQTTTSTCQGFARSWFRFAARNTAS